MPKVLTYQDFKTLPWKNGGGITRELFRLPHPTDAERFLFRLSMAHVSQNGPFSIFPGIDRTLMLLEGSGLQLLFPDDVEIALENPLEPIHFAGEDEVMAELINGEVQDFNIMIDRTWGHATTSISHEKNFQARPLTFIYDLGGNELIVLENESWKREASTTVIVVNVLTTQSS